MLWKVGTKRMKGASETKDEKHCSSADLLHLNYLHWQSKRLMPVINREGVETARAEHLPPGLGLQFTYFMS
jgi:hypothetical protein